jgi:hypothetical protein
VGGSSCGAVVGRTDRPDRTGTEAAPPDPARDAANDGDGDFHGDFHGDGQGHGPARPAFYAASPGRLRDWWTLLHPPYTAWHLGYVVIGACLAPKVQVVNLLAAVGAFFAAVGCAAHALDELHGRPLRTLIPAPALVAVAVIGLAVAVGLGAYGIERVGWTLAPFLVVGPLIVVGYNYELFGGVIHTDLGFGLGWGAFPVLVGYVGQAGTLAWAPVIAAGGAVALSTAQRSLSTPARLVRRRSQSVEGWIHLRDGSAVRLDAMTVLRPIEVALRTMSWAVVLLAASLAVARLAPG